MLLGVEIGGGFSLSALMEALPAMKCGQKQPDTPTFMSNQAGGILEVFRLVSRLLFELP